MNKAKINKFLTEYFEKCWHETEEWDNVNCRICNADLIHGDDNDFFSASGFFELIGLMKEKGVMKSFIAYLRDYGLRGSIAYSISETNMEDKIFIEVSMLDPDTFAPAVAKFLGYEEQK